MLLHRCLDRGVRKASTKARAPEARLLASKHRYHGCQRQIKRIASARAWVISYSSIYMTT